MEPAESRWQALAADLSNVERYSLLQAAEERIAAEEREVEWAALELERRLDLELDRELQRLQELAGQNLSTASSSTGGETKDDELDDEAEREAEHWFRNEEDMTALVLERMEAEQRLSAREVEVEAELEEVEAQLEEDGVIADADLDAEADDYFAAEDALAGRNVSPDALRRARCAAESPDGWLHRGSSASADDAVAPSSPPLRPPAVGRELSGHVDSLERLTSRFSFGGDDEKELRRRIPAYFHAAVLQLERVYMHHPLRPVPWGRGGGSALAFDSLLKRYLICGLPKQLYDLLHTLRRWRNNAQHPPHWTREAGPMWCDADGLERCRADTEDEIAKREAVYYSAARGLFVTIPPERADLVHGLTTFVFEHERRDTRRRGLRDAAPPEEAVAAMAARFGLRVDEAGQNWLARREVVQLRHVLDQYVETDVRPSLAAVEGLMRRLNAGLESLGVQCALSWTSTASPPWGGARGGDSAVPGLSL